MKPPNSFKLFITQLISGKQKQTSPLRDAVEDYIEQPQESDVEAVDPTSVYEKTLLSNILKLRDLSAIDVMVPRADIVAVEKDTKPKDLMELLADKQYSRVPVYSKTLDNISGVLHIKDMLGALVSGNELLISEIMRPISVIAPSMPVGELLLDMKRSRKHMAMVVDEFGGIDGLITIGDIIETIVGDIVDEHDHDDAPPEIIELNDGAIQADARVLISDFEKRFGCVFSKEEKAESDTLGGLVFFLAGRVPARGEILTHKSGMIFKVVEADARTIELLKISKIPHNNQ